MTVVVNLRSSEEEKVLLAFLNSLEYDYQTTPPDAQLTDEQENEIIRREKAFAGGQSSARTWEEIKKDLGDVYR